MKKLMYVLAFSIITSNSYAQCPNIIQAMVNSCGTNEGNNEFVLFSTNSSTNASDYTLNYGSSIPPTVNNLAGSDASIKTGTGTITTTGGCTVIEVTNPSTSIPANSRVIFIPTTFDQNYDVTALCNGSNPIYVVYIKTNANGGLNSNWNAGGTLSNNASTQRYLQIKQSNTTGCDSINAPVKSYVANGNWGSNTDGNFVTWNDTIPSYGNNGCTSIVLPLKFINLSGVNKKDYNIISWTTAEEMNVSNFIVEKSSNGKDFVSIAGFNANASSNYLQQQYKYTDNKLESPMYYYRIKAVDNNGLFSYSKTVAVQSANISASQISVYPNPAKDIITVRIVCNKISTAHMNVYDMMGKLVKTETYFNSNQISNHKLFVNELPSGKYFIRLKIGDEDILEETFLKK